LCDGSCKNKDKHKDSVFQFFFNLSTFTKMKKNILLPLIACAMLSAPRAAAQGGGVTNVEADLGPTYHRCDSVQGDLTGQACSSDAIEMVAVEGGTFTMGCTAEQGSDCYDSEKPAHSVTVSSFCIGKYEVTQAQWVSVMGSNPSYFKGDDLPVEQVSWEDVQAFIVKLNEQTGGSYRLPTEAEWEYAARGGASSAGYKYSGSNDVGAVAWYSGNSGSTTHAVGGKQENELGIYDMIGNVYEWCSDWYGAYSSSAQENPIGASSGSYRVFRGGYWYYAARDCRVACRDYDSPGNRLNGIGFRLACSSNYGGKTESVAG
jgi:formylglycine-generating enzyme required for sulfatase activity